MILFSIRVNCEKEMLSNAIELDKIELMSSGRKTNTWGQIQSECAVKKYNLCDLERSPE